jgi:protein disulfide-isomerase A1
VSVEVGCHLLNDKIAGAKLNLVYFGDFSGELFDSFMNVARNSENYLFYHASGECARAHGAKQNSITVFRTFDNSPVHYEGDSSTQSVQAFMDKSAVPQLIEFSEDYIEPIFGKGNPALILFTNDREASYNKVFSQASSDLNGEILFVVSGTEQGIQQRLAEFVGVDASAAPTLRLLAPGEEMRKFIYHGQLSTLSVNSIKEFVQDFKAGVLRPHLKSEPEPVNDGPLTVIVGTTFDKIVNDPTKDVLVKYYAPWCGHCKSLAPVWEELAAHVAGNEDLIIAKFDATANEAAGVSIRGYPTLKFYPKNNKAGIDYEGDRDLASFKKWLSENSAAYREGAAKHTTSDEL